MTNINANYSVQNTSLSPSYSAPVGKQDALAQLIQQANSGDPVSQGKALAALDALTGSRENTSALIGGQSLQKSNSVEQIALGQGKKNSSIKINYDPAPTVSKDRPYHNPSKGEGARNTIEIRYRSAFDKPVSTATADPKHLYAVYTDNNGKQTWLGGFPESPKSGGFGRIISITDGYKPGTADYGDGKTTKPYQRAATLSGSPAEVKALFTQMQANGKKIDDAKIPYLGLTENSNSFIFTVTKAALDQKGTGINLDWKAMGGFTPGSGQNLNKDVLTPQGIFKGATDQIYKTGKEMGDSFNSGVQKTRENIENLPNSMKKTWDSFVDGILNPKPLIGR
jgi:hypothetical protein